MLGKPYRDYLFQRYSYYYARNCYRYTRRLLLPIIKDRRKMLDVKKLSPRLQRAVLEAHAALRDYLSLLGVEVPLQREELKKYLDLGNEKLHPLDYEVDVGVVEKALALLSRPLWPKERTACLIAFFTGLRGTEIAYLLERLDGLRCMTLNKVSVVELEFYRKKKNAMLTMMPSKLYQALKPMKLGGRFFEHLRARGVPISLFRKSHVAILSRTMMGHEIDLLQGRVKKQLVRHYVRHIHEIAEKYHRAFGPYSYVIDALKK